MYRISFEFVGKSEAAYRRFQETGKPCLLSVRREGKLGVVLLAHGKRNKKFRLNQSAYEKADWVVCCHPNNLAKEQLGKHVFPNWDDVLTGTVTDGIWSVSFRKKYNTPPPTKLVAVLAPPPRR